MVAMKGSRTRATVALLLTVMRPVLFAQPALDRFEFTQPHMGTLFRIILYAPDAHTAARASTAAFARIAELDNIMSDYKPTSELMRFSAHAGSPPVTISEDLYRVLAAGEDLAECSEGAFDVTVEPVVRMWRRARRRHELPDPERLARARELVGFEMLRLDARERSAQLLKPGMLLDLGGIGKGYAADEALAVIKRFGISRALVAAAGDIAVGEPPPGKTGWRIEIAPLAPESGVGGSCVPAAQRTETKSSSRIQNPKSQIQIRYVILHSAGISTSGDAEQHLELAGVRYSHIVDPKSGMALTGRSSVTVVARNDFAADGLATAVSVLGPERGLKLIESTEGAGVLFVKETAAGVRTWEWRFPPIGTSRTADALTAGPTQIGASGNRSNVRHATSRQ